ncbi:unnamed protein product [Angiostrongylus costaricensis]|uniref:TPR_REGION domain-containing protein n=1 Tax=Angiostrongylus costaricensis TaxID=334426 RepID=A0A158PMF1_ANGCS|nr:unnamed protein product [Angiostrongylus costaricensis]
MEAKCSQLPTYSEVNPLMEIDGNMAGRFVNLGIGPPKRELLSGPPGTGITCTRAVANGKRNSFRIHKVAMFANRARRNVATEKNFWKQLVRSKVFLITTIQAKIQSAQPCSGLGNVFEEDGEPAEALENYKYAISLKNKINLEYPLLGLTLLMATLSWLHLDQTVAAYRNAIIYNPLLMERSGFFF